MHNDLHNINVYESIIQQHYKQDVYDDSVIVFIICVGCDSFRHNRDYLVC
jgi:hypothetical protein